MDTDTISILKNDNVNDQRIYCDETLISVIRFAAMYES